MLLQPTFDPTNPTSGQFNLNLTGGYGKAVLYNESNSNLKLIFSNNFTDYLPAWTAIELCFINIALTNPIVKYETLSTLSGIVASPISQVAIVTYEASEHVPGTYPAALVRSLSIGNQVNSTTTTNQVTNDGNPTVTTFIESTQSGNASGSNVAMGNDGSFTFAQFVSGVFTQLLQLAPGASPTLRLGKGLTLQALDAAGANLSNIFGIDSSSRTFIQAQTTGNQIAAYNKNGLNIAMLDGVTQSLQITTNQTSLNGTTAGSVTYYMFLTGNNVKALLVFFNGYQNNSVTEQHLALPVAFTQKAIVINANGKPLTPYSGNSALTNNSRVLTTIAAGGGSTTLQNAINGNSLGFFTGAFDGLGFGTSQVSTATDIAFIIGF